MNLHRIGAVALAIVVLAACSATDQRISNNEALFNSYPPDVQAMIKSNRIAKGFDQTQVYLAFGNADSTKNEDGIESWIYTEVHQKYVQTKKDVHKYALEVKEYHDALHNGELATEPSTEETIKLYRTRVARVVQFGDGHVDSWTEPGDEWLDDWHQ